MDYSMPASWSFSISWSVLKFMSIELVMLLTNLFSAASFPFCFQSFSALGSFPERSNPPSKEQQLHWHRRAERSYSTSKVRRGGHEDIPLIQGKRNPSKMVGVERGHKRADTLKPYSQKTSQSDHTDHSLVSLNETKPCRVGPTKMGGSWWRGLTEHGPLEKGMANHFSSLALRTP